MQRMKASCSSRVTALRRAWRRVPGTLLAVALLGLAACSRTAVVTLTSTAPQDNFLAYRGALFSVQLQGPGGKSGLTVLPASTALGQFPASTFTLTSTSITLFLNN